MNALRYWNLTAQWSSPKQLMLAIKLQDSQEKMLLLTSNASQIFFQVLKNAGPVFARLLKKKNGRSSDANDRLHHSNKFIFITINIINLQ